MNEKIRDLALGLCTLGEIACVGMIAGIALKRNNDCYKAECKLIDSEFKLAMTEMDVLVKEHEIDRLKEDIKQLKAKYEEES